MKDSRAIGVLVIALAIINISLLIFLWIGYQQNQKPRVNQKGLLVLENALDLNEEQKHQIRDLRQSHFIEMDSLRKQSHEIREELHSLWSKQRKVTEAERLSTQLGELHKEIELATFEHFSAIRSICTAEQAEIFDGIIKDILRQGDRRPNSPQRRPNRRPENNRP